MRKTLWTIVVAVAVGISSLGLAGTASAAVYKPVTCYETVVCYETRTVPFKKHVTRYDDCGRPYTVCVTCYRTVKVPVEKVVAVTKWVKVCD